MTDQHHDHAKLRDSDVFHQIVVVVTTHAHIHAHTHRHIDTHSSWDNSVLQDSFNTFPPARFNKAHELYNHPLRCIHLGWGLLKLRSLISP